MKPLKRILEDLYNEAKKKGMKGRSLDIENWIIQSVMMWLEQKRQETSEFNFPKTYAARQQQLLELLEELKQ